MFILKHLIIPKEWPTSTPTNSNSNSNSNSNFVWTVSLNYWEKSMVLPRINKKFPKKKKKGLLSKILCLRKNSLENYLWILMGIKYAYLLLKW